MLATIRKFLSFLEYLCLVAFSIIFGLTILPKSAIGAIVIFMFTLALLITLFRRKERVYFPARIVRMGKPMLTPVIDIVLVAYSIQDWKEITELNYLKLFYLTAVIALSIDLLIWILISIDEYIKTPRRTWK